jgi:hypothetical protein
MRAYTGLDPPQPHVDDLDADRLRVAVGLLARRVHDLVALRRDRLVHRALVEFLGHVRAHGLRQAAARGFLVALHRHVEAAHVVDAPQHDELDQQRLFLGGRDAVRLRNVERQVAAVEVLDVLHHRELEVQAGVGDHFDHLAQLELDRGLRLVDGEHRLRRHEDRGDDDGDERHRESHG